MNNVNLLKIYLFFGASSGELIFNSVSKKDGTITLMVSDANFEQNILLERIMNNDPKIDKKIKNSEFINDFFLLVEKNNVFKNFIKTKCFCITINIDKMYIFITCIPYISGGTLLFKFDKIKKKIDIERGM